MATARKHKKPQMAQELVEAEKVARQMYDALKAPGAPKATPTGYVLGACQVLKMLTEQAAKQQGCNMDDLKLFIHQFVHNDIK